MSGSTQSNRPLDGGAVLYGYLQHELLSSDVWLFQMLTARLIVGLGVWLGPEIYARHPLLRPHAVRDPAARGNAARGMPDEWGAPNGEGLFRDDNSLIKRMPYSLTVRAPRNRRYNGARLERGFVASHVWRTLEGDGGLASRNRLTYSFVPNLVWLPREISMLTDREGSFVQEYIQAISLKLYRRLPVSDALRPLVEESWSLLPEPRGVPSEGLPDVSELNIFVPTERFFGTRRRDLERVIEALRLLRQGGHLTGKVVASRYGAGLSKLSRRDVGKLERTLDTYRAALPDAASPAAR
jgi:hypothetical protein